MIQFVLEHPRGQVPQFLFAQLPRFVRIADLDSVGTDNDFPDTGHGKAALFVLPVLIGCRKDLGIDEYAVGAAVPEGAFSDHEETLLDPGLIGRETDPVVVVHGFDHIGDIRDHILPGCHRRHFFPQQRITVFAYR